MSLKKKYNLKLIEDTCESLGSKFKYKYGIRNIIKIIINKIILKINR